jgi:SAM-dependent methyltransferase
MLDFAQNKALLEGVRGEYLLGDITKFKSPKKFDFVTAINDCFNYVSKEKLGKAFQNVKSVLNKGGIFLFDISSEKKIREKIANTVSVDDRDEITYLSFNRLEEDKAIMDVTLFIKNKDGSYSRTDETHTQFIYTEEEITAALTAGGFTLVRVEGHMGEDKNTSDRLCFLAVKEG